MKQVQKLQEIQIRFLIGTLVLWAIATLIFGVNLTVYGVTNALRWATYIEGAALILTGVVYPVEIIRLIRDRMLEVKNWAITNHVIEFKPRKITITETLRRFQALLKMTIPNGGKTDKDVIAYLEDQVETAVLMKFPQNGDEFPPEELTHIFHPDHLQALKEITMTAGEKALVKIHEKMTPESVESSKQEYEKILANSPDDEIVIKSITMVN